MYSDKTGDFIRECYRGKNILVTGGAGAIGSNLVSALASMEVNKVIILDDLSSSAEWLVPTGPNIEFVKGDILNEQDLRRVFFHRPSIVFHLAALFANQNSVDHPETDLLVNGMGTLRVLQSSVIAGVERVVYASSSSAVYAGLPMPLVEDSISLRADTPYQATKMLGELYCTFFQSYYGLSTVRARFFNSYGPGELPGKYRNVIPNFIFLALQGKPLPVMGTGEDTRDWTYIDDIVDGLLRMGCIERASGEVFNLGTGTETQVIEVAKLVNELTENQAGIEFVQKRLWDRTTRRVASIEKAQSLLGYAPRHLLYDGIATTIAWFRQHWEKLVDEVGE